LLAGISEAEDITNPILKKLVEKGILSQQEAISVMHEMEKEKAKKEKTVEQKIEQKVSEATPTESKDMEKIVKALKGFKFGLLWYLSYQGGEEKNGTDFSRGVLKRGYLTVQKEFLPWFSARLTTDVTQVTDQAKDSNGKVYSDFDGSIAVRIKYLFGQFNLPDIAFLTKPFIEFGQVHMPWLDYEENLNWYRCQDTMFVERNNTFNSADIGINFVSLLGGVMDEEYQKNVNSAYPGRYGSIALAVMNGSGYHASENNKNKVLEGRFTLRPLPDVIPGLQFSYFGTTGKGNKDTNPKWTTNLAFSSFESEPIVLTGQYYWGIGNQSGADENKKEGYSFFTELKLYNMFKDSLNRFSIIGRYDHFDPDTRTAKDDNNRTIAGIAYYLDKPHKNMILIDYDHVDYKASYFTGCSLILSQGLFINSPCPLTLRLALYARYKALLTLCPPTPGRAFFLWNYV
jgi:hypothetical protein